MKSFLEITKQLEEAKATYTIKDSEGNLKHAGTDKDTAYKTHKSLNAKEPGHKLYKNGVPTLAEAKDLKNIGDLVKASHDKIKGSIERKSKMSSDERELETEKNIKSKYKNIGSHIINSLKEVDEDTLHSYTQELMKTNHPDHKIFKRATTLKGDAYKKYAHQQDTDVRDKLLQYVKEDSLDEANGPPKAALAFARKQSLAAALHNYKKGMANDDLSKFKTDLNKKKTANEELELDESDDMMKRIHKEYTYHKSRPTADVLKTHKNLSNVRSQNYTAGEMGGKEGLISDIMNNTHGSKRMAAYHAMKPSERKSLDEVLSKDSSAGEWISDFIKSDNPMFAGKSEAKRKQMALAAYYAKQNEDISIDEISKEVVGKYLDKVTKNQIKTQGFQPNMYDKLPAKRQTGVNNAFKRLKENISIDEESRAETGELFKSLLDRASAASDRGDHTQAKRHLDNARTARFGILSKHIPKHTANFDKYNKLKNSYTHNEAVMQPNGTDKIIPDEGMCEDVCQVCGDIDCKEHFYKSPAVTGYVKEGTEHIVHVDDGSKYDEEPHPKDVEHVMSGAKRHNGKFDGNSDKGAFFKFGSRTDARNFVDHVKKSPHRSVSADLHESLDEVSTQLARKVHSARFKNWDKTKSPEDAAKMKKAYAHVLVRDKKDIAKLYKMTDADYQAQHQYNRERGYSNESFEAIDEISKETLGDYVHRSFARGNEIHKQLNKQVDDVQSPEERAKLKAELSKRNQGVIKASRKMRNESQDKKPYIVISHVSDDTGTRAGGEREDKQRVATKMIASSPDEAIKMARIHHTGRGRKVHYASIKEETIHENNVKVGSNVTLHPQMRGGQEEKGKVVGKSGDHVDIEYSDLMGRKKVKTVHHTFVKEAVDTVERDASGKLISWSREGDWQNNSTKKQGQGKAANLAGRALQQTKKLNKEPSSYKNSDGTPQSRMSRARALAKQAMKNQMKEDIDRLFEKDEREYGYEGEMVMTQLKTLCRHAEHLMGMLEPDTDLPEWVQSKITLATDYMQTAHDYLMSEMNESLDEAAWGNDKMTSLRQAHDRHMDKALAANKAGDDEAVKTHQRKMQMIQGKMQKLKRNEEVELGEECEILSELSKKTLGSYVKKAADDKAFRMHTQHHFAHNQDIVDGERKKFNNRDSGIKKAVNRLTGSKISFTDNKGNKKRMHIEEVEELDELSKSTLGSYIKKASEQGKKAAVGVNQSASGASDAMDKGNSRLYDLHSDNYKYSKNLEKKRAAGVSRAVDKLTKEDNMLTYSEFMASILESRIDDLKDKLAADREKRLNKMDYSKEKEKSPIRKVQGHSYGAGDEDEESDDDAVKTFKPAAEKRGRGRPAGSKSGSKYR